MADSFEISKVSHGPLINSSGQISTISGNIPDAIIRESLVCDTENLSQRKNSRISLKGLTGFLKIQSKSISSDDRKYSLAQLSK